jgi:hypothetical protein
MVLVCPDCQGRLDFAASWTFRDLWGYTEVRTSECPTHGPVFFSPEISPVAEPHPSKCRASDDDGDPDLLVPARRKPAPTRNTTAIAVPEPGSD